MSGHFIKLIIEMMFCLAFLFTQYIDAFCFYQKCVHYRDVDGMHDKMYGKLAQRSRTDSVNFFIK